MTQQQFPVKDEIEEEIDLLKHVKTLWNGRKTLFVTLLSGAILGLLVALLTPKQYSVTTIMVPQMDQSKSKLGGLGGLAALAGIDIGSSIQTGELSPILYPKIVNSIPFKLELMNTPIQFDNIDHPVSLFEYYTEHSKTSVLGTIRKYTLGLPGLIIKSIKGEQELQSQKSKTKNDLISLSEEQYIVSKNLDDIIYLVVEKKEGYLTLVVQMPEPLAAAQFAKKAQEILQRYIINFKIQKAKADLDFIQERYNTAKAEAEGYQYSIAKRTDQYKNLTSTVPQVETTRISTRYGIANTVFQELAKQLEQAKIQVKKDTPTFTIIEPVTIPFERSKPNRLLILIIWTFVGGIVGVGIVFGKQIIAEMRRKWDEK